MLERIAYHRRTAVAYAHRWAFQRNPKYYDYEEIGGDCTNFASQCLYAGAGVMDFTPDFGWYYLNANDKAPAWTGVEYFYRYLTRQEPTPGPSAELVRLSQLFPGDFVQLSARGDIFTHTAIVVQILAQPSLRGILVASHSYDADYRPLSSYAFQKARFLHINGVWRETNVSLFS